MIAGASSGNDEKNMLCGRIACLGALRKRQRMNVDVVGARIREAREQAGLSQYELARRTGMHPPTISRYETGKMAPSLQALATLSDLLERPMSWFLGESEAVLIDDVAQRDPPGWREYLALSEAADVTDDERWFLRECGRSAVRRGYAPSLTSYGSWLGGLRMAAPLS